MLCRMLEALPSKPPPMSDGPVLAAVEDAAVTEKKSHQLLAFLPQIFCCCLACPRQVANGFMDRIRHPYRGQFAGSMQPCQHHGITASRRLVLTRSPGFFGMSDGATTAQSWPSALTWRYSP